MEAASEDAGGLDADDEELQTGHVQRRMRRLSSHQAADRFRPRSGRTQDLDKLVRGLSRSGTSGFCTQLSKRLQDLEFFILKEMASNDAQSSQLAAGSTISRPSTRSHLVIPPRYSTWSTASELLDHNKAEQSQPGLPPDLAPVPSVPQAPTKQMAETWTDASKKEVTVSTTLEECQIATSTVRFSSPAARSSLEDGDGAMKGGNFKRRANRHYEDLVQAVEEEVEFRPTATGVDSLDPEFKDNPWFAMFKRVVKNMQQDQSFNLFLETFFGTVIILNAAVIGLSCDVQPDWGGWLIVDASFAVLFSVELILKGFMLREDFIFGSERSWNLFETLLVIMSYVEFAVAAHSRVNEGNSSGTSNISLLRICRLARISRLLRVIKLPMFCELKIMISGALGGIRTLLWVPVMICLPLYAAAIAYRETLGSREHEGSVSENFSSVSNSFFTLFRCIVATECIDELGRPIFKHVADDGGWGYSFGYSCLHLLMTFGLFNVIIAIFIENVLAGAKTNDLVMQRERLRDKTFFAAKMTEFVAVLMQVDQEMQGVEVAIPTHPQKLLKEVSYLQITREVLDETLSRPHVREILRDLALAEEDVGTLFDTLDADASGSIDMTELFDGISRLRGAPRRSDVVSLAYLMEQMQEELWEQSENIRNVYRAMLAKVDMDTVPRRRVVQAMLTNDQQEEAAGTKRKVSATRLEEAQCDGGHHDPKESLSI